MDDVPGIRLRVKLQAHEECGPVLQKATHRARKNSGKTADAALNYTSTKDTHHANQFSNPKCRPRGPAFRRIGLCRHEGSKAALAPFVYEFTKALRQSLRAFLISS